MRTAFFLALVALCTVHVVQASKHAQSVAPKPRHTFTLQRNAVPKMTTVSTKITDGSFEVLVSFAHCITGTLTKDHFSFSNKFVTTDVTVTERIKGIQYTLKGKTKNFETGPEGKLFAVSLDAKAVTMRDVHTGEGIPSKANAVTMTYYQSNEFTTNAVALIQRTPSQHVDFQVTFSSACVPAANKKSTDVMFAQYFKCTGATTVKDSVKLESTSVSTAAGMKTFIVRCVTTQGTDTVTLTVEKGLCNTFGGSTSKKATATFDVDTSTGHCGEWSAWSACTKNCYSTDKFFNILAGERCRTRKSLPGKNCATKQECRKCVDKHCLDGSRPFAGENLQECFGCNEAGYKGVSAAAGCRCANDCEEKGDCCQDWFRQGCNGAKATSKLYKAQWRPRMCTLNLCKDTEPLVSIEFPSYYCYCHSSCGATATKNDECCDGQYFRDQQCSPQAPATSPASAPGSAPGGAPGR